MGVTSLIGSVSRALRESPPPKFGAMAFSGRTVDGSPVIQFSRKDVQQLRLAAGVTNYADIYRTQPSVRICVDFLANNIAHLNLKTYRKPSEGARVPEPNHPLAQLLRRPNPRTDYFDLMRGTVSDLAIYDTAFWLKLTVGQQRSLFRIPPAFVTAKGGSILTGPQKYVIDTGNGPNDFRPDEIVHFHGYHPLDTRSGQSTLEALKDLLSEEVESSKNRRFFWKNSARMGGILEVPGELSDTAFNRLKTQWRNRTAGARNSGETAIAEGGSRFRNDSFSPKDSEFIAGREWALDVTATAYNIPLAMLSRKGAATFASMKEFRTILYVDVLGPWNASIEGAIWLQLIPDFEDPELFTEFNIEEKLQGDFEGSAEAIRSSVQVPWMSINAALKLRNMPPIGDPDDPENPYNVPARPQNFDYGLAQTPSDVVEDPATVVRPRLAPAASNGHETETVPEDLAELFG